MKPADFEGLIKVFHQMLMVGGNLTVNIESGPVEGEKHSHVRWIIDTYPQRVNVSYKVSDAVRQASYEEHAALLLCRLGHDLTYYMEHPPEPQGATFESASAAKLNEKCGGCGDD